MNTSAEENNPEVFPGNKTGGIHCCKQKKKTQHIRKQNKTKTCNHKKWVQCSKQETERFVSNCKQKNPL